MTVLELINELEGFEDTDEVYVSTPDGEQLIVVGASEDWFQCGPGEYDQEACVSLAVNKVQS